MTKTTYRMKCLLGVYSSRGLGVHHHHVRERVSRPVGIKIEHLKDHIQVYKQETENTLGNAGVFETIIPPH